VVKRLAQADVITLGAVPSRISCDDAWPAGKETEAPAFMTLLLATATMVLS